MKYTTGQRSAHGLISTAVILVIAYGFISILIAIKFLGQDELTTSFPYHHMRGLAAILLQLGILSGVLGGGLFTALSSRQDSDVAQPKLLRWVYLLWLLFVSIAVLSAALGLLDGRPNLELVSALDVPLLILLALFLFITLASAAKSPPVIVWSAAVIIGIIGLVVGLLPYSSFEQELMLRVIAGGLVQNIGYPLAAVALIFWLIPRFSTAGAQWANTGVFSCGGLVILAGAVLTVQPLANVSAADVTDILVLAGVVIIPAAYLVTAAHLYHALSNRNNSGTLSAHWVALGVFCWVAASLLGAVNAVPSIQAYTAGTRLVEAQTLLFAFGVVAVVLGAANQINAELRGSNQRATGLMPFWLIAFGGLISAGIVLSAGVVQVFMERRASVGYLDVQTLIVPLYIMWVAALVFLFIGLLIYGIAYYSRRPRESSSAS